MRANLHSENDGATGTPWSELAQNELLVKVPQWHKDLLDEREALIQEDKAKFIDWETAKKQIQAATS